MLDILIPIGILTTSFLLGVLVCWAAIKFKAKLMFYLYGKPVEPKTTSERLEKILDAWLGLKAMFFTWRSGLSPNKYFAANLLMSEIDELLEIVDKRKTKTK